MNQYGTAVVHSTEGVALDYTVSSVTLKNRSTSATQSVNRQVINDPATQEPMTVVTSGRAITVSVDLIPTASTKATALTGLVLPTVQAKVTISGAGSLVNGDYNFTGNGSVRRTEGSEGILTLELVRYPDSAVSASTFASAIAS